MSTYRFSLVLVAIVASSAISIVAYTKFSDSRARAIAEVTAVDDDRRTISRIELLRREPSVVGTRARQAGVISKSIEDAAFAAGVESRSVTRIAPEPARRLGSTPYLKNSTQVLLREVTMAQLCKFFGTLSLSGDNLRVDRIVLGSGRESTTAETWNAELTVTYWVYSPIRQGPTIRTDSTSFGAP